MSYLVWLVPIALAMGLGGLVAFLWSVRAGQYEDLDGAAERVLLAGENDRPLPKMEMHASVQPGADGSAVQAGQNELNQRRHT